MQVVPGRTLSMMPPTSGRVNGPTAFASARAAPAGRRLYATRGRTSGCLLATGANPRSYNRLQGSSGITLISVNERVVLGHIARRALNVPSLPEKGTCSFDVESGQRRHGICVLACTKSVATKWPGLMLVRAAGSWRQNVPAGPSGPRAARSRSTRRERTPMCRCAGSSVRGSRAQGTTWTETITPHRRCHYAHAKLGRFVDRS